MQHTNIFFQSTSITPTYIAFHDNTPCHDLASHDSKHQAAFVLSKRFSNAKLIIHAYKICIYDMLPIYICNKASTYHDQSSSLTSLASFLRFLLSCARCFLSCFSSSVSGGRHFLQVIKMNWVQHKKKKHERNSGVKTLHINNTHSNLALATHVFIIVSSFVQETKCFARSSFCFLACNKKANMLTAETYLSPPNLVGASAIAAPCNSTSVL